MSKTAATPKARKPSQKGSSAKTRSKAANANGNGNGNGHGNGQQPEEARRVAMRLGHAMLAANSAETADHSDDVVVIAEAICERMGINGSLGSDIRAAAQLHDIGKASISKEILDKPGPLTPSEWALIREHTVIGERILSSVDELEEVARLVRHSHERWDGQGYPDGLVGEEIPIGSRIVFCADAFHAIRSDRPYRGGRRAPDALAEIKRCSATQFDPEVVAALDAVARELKLVPEKRRNGSSRLAALLMMLALGTGSSAVAQSGLLGTPHEPHTYGPTALDTLPECGPGGCPSLLGITISEQAGGGSGPELFLPPGVVFVPGTNGQPGNLAPGQLTPPGNSGNAPGRGGDGAGQGNAGGSSGDPGARGRDNSEAAGDNRSDTGKDASGAKGDNGQDERPDDGGGGAGGQGQGGQGRPGAGGGSPESPGKGTPPSPPGSAGQGNAKS